MAENINKRPAKGILKSSGSVERQDHPSTSKRAKEQRFDEMNILATLHPPDKDYGHMKIDEPKTPYSEFSDPNLNPQTDEVDAQLLAAKLNASKREPPPEVCVESSDEEEEPETAEEKQQRIEFEARRKKHYNEFQAIQLARKLMEEEEEDDDEERGSPRVENDDPSVVQMSPPRAQLGFMQNKRDAEKSSPWPLSCSAVSPFDLYI